MKKAMVLLIVLMGVLAAIAPDGDLIVNGDFSQSDCSQDSCLLDAPDAVRNWATDGQIEIGYGYVYSNSLGNERVLILAPASYICARQAIQNVKSGYYKLKFDWGAKKG